MLSDIGQTRLERLLNLLECSQGLSPLVFEKTVLNIEKIKAKVPPKLDLKLPRVSLNLAQLPVGNLALEHWLLTRIFLTEQELSEKSLAIEP